MVKPTEIVLFWCSQIQKVFLQALTDLTIITSQYVYFHCQTFFGNFLLHSKKMGSADIKQDTRPSKLIWGYRKQMRWLHYFNHKHSCVNSIWYLCCLSLEEQYLRRICGLLSWLTTLKIRRKLNFRINNHLEFVMIVC